ncbi:MAG TPA: TIGR04282 family arsenosugar biosynthesis glycosyltransferase [Nitrospiraceae bacterium]|jgi:rSAM/selenodomain-associated transferase 1
MKHPERPSTLSAKQPAEGALIIFAKAPVPGQVKTRLCPPLTPDEAATLHGSFVLDALERTKAAIAKWRLPVDRFIACFPSASLVFFKILEERHGVQLLDQVGDDLGQRMERAFADLFKRGYRKVVLMGTDVPSLPLSEYHQAFSSLDAHDLVLGPATDGGYYLIGLKRPVVELFRDVQWSTPDVLAVTQRKADTLGLRRALLKEWRDIDVVDDLRALIRDCDKDKHQPKQDRTFSLRTAGTLQLLNQRLVTR